MICMIIMYGMEKVFYFVSDHHFGKSSNEKKKIRKFIEFIDHIMGCEALFIVGDLFDFYFEYRTQIPKPHFEIFSALHRLKMAGTKIYYIVGNHDFWVDDFFTNTLGIEVYKEPLTIVLQGKKIFIAHGDKLLGDAPIRWLLRNKLSIFLFYWIHPDIAQAIGRKVSKLSSKIPKDIKMKTIKRIWRQKKELGFDTVILGHIHTPIHIRIENQKFKSSKKDLLLLGSWRYYFTYGKLANGELSLLKW